MIRCILTTNSEIVVVERNVETVKLEQIGIDKCAKCGGLTMANYDSTRVSLLNKIADPQNHEAWTRFVDRYGPMIRAWCRRNNVPRQDADDLVQDVLLKVARAIKDFEYDPNKSFRAFLRTIFANAWTDLGRKLEKRRRHGEVAPGGEINLEVLAQVPNDLRDEFVEGIHSDTSGLLDDALREARKQVSGRDWEIWNASMIDGDSDASIAYSLRKTRGAVQSAKYRVNKRIREIYNKMIDDA